MVRSGSEVKLAYVRAGDLAGRQVRARRDVSVCVCVLVYNTEYWCECALIPLIPSENPHPVLARLGTLWKTQRCAALGTLCIVPPLSVSTVKHTHVYNAQLKCDRLNGIHVKLHSLTNDKSRLVDFAPKLCYEGAVKLVNC